MKALITGITGQDGSYLAEFLLSRGYEIHGTLRLSTKDNLDNIGHISNRLCLHRIDLLSQLSLVQLIEQTQPDEIYHLAALTEPDADWNMPELFAQYNALSVVRLLEAVKAVRPKTRFFQASSCEMLAGSSALLDEDSRQAPLTPASTAKQYAHWTAKSYRDKYGMPISTGILFNHTSPRRDTRFLTRQITMAAAKIKLGLQEKLTLPSLSITKDWGFAGDFVRAFWMMLQHPVPDDYVIATGQEHQLEEYCRLAFDTVDLDWHDHVTIKSGDSTETKQERRIGNPTKARRELLWEPEVDFDRLVGMMVEADLERFTLKNRLSSFILNQDKTEKAVV